MSASSGPESAVDLEQLRATLRKYWGFDEFRPLQAEAMQCVLSGQDSVVIMPTGGGKSLCFQAPALLMPGLGLVVSPLISLMKDQVDSLADCGVPAACVTSQTSPDERRRVANEIRAGRLKLLYLSPERLMTDRMLEFLRETPLSFAAVDEAHCISDWGHDFRPEYRMLSRLKELFPKIAVHAYTATATETVRRDIAKQLKLSEAEVLVGSFDRPNLVYRVRRRGNVIEQVREVAARHADRSGIIYCIRRQDTEDMCAALKVYGLDALPYHAGLSDEERQHNQDAFINDRVKLIVATVAFGMGIDKSDVRFVIHAGAPKSLEAYQQESGRAGRDGLEAECWLLHSPGDFFIWRKFQENMPAEAAKVAAAVLAGIETYCQGADCRHRALVRHFGQDLPGGDCQACDACLGELELLPDALVIGQKILSCVLRLQENFGGGYTAQVLTGSREQRILANGHDKLSTWGLLAEHDKSTVQDWIEQLIGQDCLQRYGEFSQLQVTPAGRRLLRGEETPRLLKPPQKAAKTPVASRASWEGVDRELFEALRTLRRQRAEERGLPPFIVFGDATLRDLARRRPSTREKLLEVHGIGERKAAEYGAEFLQAIADYCRRNDVAQDAAGKLESAVPQPPSLSPSGRAPAAAKLAAFEMFARGASIDEVCERIARARSSVTSYLAEHIQRQGICDPAPWVEAAAFERIAAACQQHGMERLAPLHEALGGAYEYDQIKLTIACLSNSPPG